MIDAAFDCATRLFGLKFREIKGFQGYHPDVRAWEVFDKSGDSAGLFIGDYFARASKRSGAWMSSFRTQHQHRQRSAPDHHQRVELHQRRQTANRLCCRSMTRARCFMNSATGCMACCRTSRIRRLRAPRSRPISSNCRRSFTSIGCRRRKCSANTPSTTRPASRCRASLHKRLKAARNFNQGFATVEYTASALVDMSLYEAGGGSIGDIEKFEAETLERHRHAALKS